MEFFETGFIWGIAVNNKRHIHFKSKIGEKKIYHANNNHKKGEMTI